MQKWFPTYFKTENQKSWILPSCFQVGSFKSKVVKLGFYSILKVQLKNLKDQQPDSDFVPVQKVLNADFKIFQVWDCKFENCLKNCTSCPKLGIFRLTKHPSNWFPITVIARKFELIYIFKLMTLKHSKFQTPRSLLRIFIRLKIRVMRFQELTWNFFQKRFQNQNFEKSTREFFRVFT